MLIYQGHFAVYILYILYFCKISLDVAVYCVNAKLATAKLAKARSIAAQTPRAAKTLMKADNTNCINQRESICITAIMTSFSL